MTAWTAYERIGLLEGAIITVDSNTEDQARERVAAELAKNESRRWYLKKWAADGFIVKPAKF